VRNKGKREKKNERLERKRKKTKRGIVIFIERGKVLRKQRKTKNKNKNKKTLHRKVPGKNKLSKIPSTICLLRALFCCRMDDCKRWELLF
jgi:hypothetical protein